MSVPVSSRARPADPAAVEPAGKARALSASAPRAGAPSAALCVRAVFHGLDERQAQAIAAELIARAHELANQPDSECDVDVSVELASESSPAR